MKRLACALALAGSVWLLAANPGDARAAPPRPKSPLQLSILTPDPGSIGDRISLDVSFRGGTVETVELRLDGALVAQRQLSTAQTRGIITFTLDAVQLTAGDHELEVKAYGPDGRTATSAAKIRIPALDLTAPVRIAYPQNGIQVSGVVPIRVSLDTDLQRQKPYVTFFVDKELKVLRNFPPYEYSWDTTRETNGWHIVEAWTQTSDAISPTKARPVHVNVNNASGETKKLGNIEDLRNPPITLNPQPSHNQPDRGQPVTSTHVTTPVVEPGAGAVRTSVRPRSMDSAANQPSLYGLSSTSPVQIPTPGVVVRSEGVATNHPMPRMVGGAAQEPRGHLSVPAPSHGLLPPVPNDPSGLFPVIAPSRGGADTTLVVRPGETLDSVAKRAGVSPDEVRRLNNLPRGKQVAAGNSLVVPAMGSFDVAFDGDRIAFDVAPRIESGVKLAPFRQIFEHTGGRLYWFGGQAQTVRAVNDSREIELKIGSAKALVNNSAVTMERKPFIDTGRTIVPLTFIRDALNVKIHFDVKTGRLLIESGKL